MTTCSELHLDLKRLFAAPGYVYMKEVRNATGFESTRSADALALGMYQSKGRELWGFEMKVSRTDWKKEMDQAEKAESWMRFCDRWAVVVSDTSIVHTGELPPTWGMYAPVKGKIKCVVAAPKLEPIPLNRVALTALMYASSKVDQAATQKLIDESVELAKKSFYDRNQHDAEAFRELSEKVRSWEKHTGIRISYSSDENLKELGTVVNMIRYGEAGIRRRMDTLEYAISSVEEMIPTMKAQLEVLQKAQNMEEAITDNED